MTGGLAESDRHYLTMKEFATVDPMGCFPFRQTCRWADHPGVAL